MKVNLKKLTFHLLSSIFYLLLCTSPVFALRGDPCTYPQYCNFTGTDPTSGEQSCSGTINLDTDRCEYDPEVLPECSECTAIPSPTPTPTPETSPSPSVSVTATASAKPGENVVYNLNRGMFDPAVIKDAPENTGGNFINLIVAALTGLFSQPVKFFTQSGTLQQANLPEELKPSSDKLIFEQVEGYLGGSSGFFGASLPDQAIDKTGSLNLIDPSEKAYQQANFPEEVKPVTGE